MPNQIKLRYPGTCKTCGAALAKGVEAWHFKDEKKVECLACHANPPARVGSVAPPGVAESSASGLAVTTAGAAAIATSRSQALDQPLAGESAQREYDQRSAKHKKEVEARWGSKIGKVVLLLENEKQSTASWAKGAKGEQKAGAHLEKKLDGTGCEILHDRRIPESRANIDHIVIGPAGVTVIDTKNYTGDCRVKTVGIGKRKRRLLMVDGYDRTKLIDGVLGQVEVVRAVLAEADFAFKVETRGMLCWWNYEGLPLIGTNKIEIEGVKVMNPRGTTNFAGRDGPLGLGQIQAVADFLDGRLRGA